jgi:thioredoxin-related protein
MMRTLTITALAAAMLAAPAVAADMDYFKTTYAEAEKLAKKEGKPLYLHFTTTWCGWCRRIENEVYKVADGKKALSPFVCATLDCTVPSGQKPSKDAKFNMDLMRKYGGSGYPFLVMLTTDGVLLHKIGGYKPLPAFKKELAAAEASNKKAEEFKAYAAKADKSTYEYNSKALDFYSSTLAWEKAGKAAAAIKKLDPKLAKSNAALVHYAVLMGASSETDEAARRTMEDQVVKSDPTNANGYMEKVLWARAQGHLQKTRGAEPETKQAHLRKAADALDLLVHKAKKLSDEANVYGFQGYIHTQLGNSKAAVTALEKSISLDPDSRRSAYFKTLIEKLKKPAEEK